MRSNRAIRLIAAVARGTRRRRWSGRRPGRSPSAAAAPCRRGPRTSSPSDLGDRARSRAGSRARGSRPSTTWSSVRSSGLERGQVELALGRGPARRRAGGGRGCRCVGPSNAASSRSSIGRRLARPGMQPSVAHEPKATRIADLRRSSRASSAFSVLRMPPVNRVRSIEPSGIASTSAYLASMTAGQNTISKRSAKSRIASCRLSTLMSQPPQAAAQYIAKRCLTVGAHAAASASRPASALGASTSPRRAVVAARPPRPRRPAPRSAQPGPSPAGRAARTSSTIRRERRRRAAGPRPRWRRRAGSASGSMPSSLEHPAQQLEAAQRLDVLDPVVAVGRPAAGHRRRRRRRSRTPCRTNVGSSRPEHISRTRRTLGGYLIRAVPARSAAR